MVCPVLRIPAMSTILHRRGFTLVEIMIVVVIIGLLAAIAIPGFRRIHASSQDKAVLSNLRQISAAGDQYFLEFGVTSVNSSVLVGGNSSQYVKTFQTVAGETYSDVLLQNGAITASGVSGARTITFGP